MGRALTLMSIAAAIAAAISLYTINYATRALRTEVETAERRIEDLTRETAILRAERAFLARPERLEPAARRLGMAPIDGRQIEIVRPHAEARPVPAAVR